LQITDVLYATRKFVAKTLYVIATIIGTLSLWLLLVILGFWIVPKLMRLMELSIVIAVRMKSKTELLSAMLEVISFFLVTIDLYGRERLDRLQNRFAVAVEVMQEARGLRIIERFDFNKHKITKSLLNNFIRVTVIGMFIASWWWLYIIVENFVDPYVGSYVSIFVASVVGIVGSFLITYYGIHYLFGLPLVIWIVALIFLRSINALFIKYKLEGIFLCVGAVLFLCSKALIIGHLSGQP
jgi:hypothetical protein